MTEISKPTGLNIQWASAGDILDPGDTKYQTGWEVEIPPRQWENYIQNKQDKFIAHANQHGVVVWDNETEYQTDKSYVQGATNGIVYRCVLTHGGTPATAEDPEADVGNTYWEVAFAEADTAYTKTESDGLYLTKVQNLADLPNTTTARANLSVYSKTETYTKAEVDASSINTVRIDVASASTVSLTTAAPNTRHINITGITTINGFTAAAGVTYFVRFNDALTLTNSAALVTQTGANIRTAGGDTCIIRATAANVVEILCYTSAAPPFTGAFTSAEQVITSGGGLAIAHGLASQPFFVSLELVNVVADAGYAPGDRLQRPGGGSGYGGGSSIEVWPDSSNINVRFGTLSYSVGHKTTGAQTSITLTSWRVVLRAFV